MSWNPQIQLGLSLLPWAFFLPLLIRKRGSMQRFEAYLWLWALATPIFFTFAGNILWTYLLPSLPAWAMLLSGRICDAGPKTTWAAATSAVVLPIVGAGIIIAGVMEQRPQNQRDVVEAWSDLQSAQSAPLIYPAFCKVVVASAVFLSCYFHCRLLPLWVECDGADRLPISRCT